VKFYNFLLSFHMKFKGFLIFLLISHLAFAQSRTELTQRFEQGKALLQKGNYTAAKENFAALLPATPENIYNEYAYYYCGLSDYYAKKPKEAQLFLRQLLEKYPAWNKTEEVRYLLAQIAFEQKDEGTALIELGKIINQALQPDVRGLKQFYLGKKDLFSLKELHRKFPEDENVSEMLYFQMIKSKDISKEDQQTVRQLDKKYNFSTRQSQPEVVPVRQTGKQLSEKSTKKEIYNIAALFPFATESLDPAKSVRGNQLVLDMYEGMQIGAAQLEKQNVRLNLTAFDVGKDGNQMLELINQPDFQEMDLLVGPFYPQPNQIAVSFANQQEVALVNPISSNSKIIENQPFGFLFKPSSETRIRQASEFAITNFSDKPLVIFYGTTEEDSVFAAGYQKKMEEAGQKVLAFRKIGTAETGQMASVLAGKNDKNLSHIFIATANAKVVSSFMNALETISSKIPVLTPSDWFRFENVSFERFESRNIHFIYPEYIDPQQSSVKEFKQLYLKKTNLIPSFYAYQGYELMLFFGKMLHEEGRNFITKLHEKEKIKGNIFSGYSFYKANDNQYVPVFKFEHNDLKLLNPVE
jgi:hypothetical protein